MSSGRGGRSNNNRSQAYNRTANRWSYGGINNSSSASKKDSWASRIKSVKSRQAKMFARQVKDDLFEDGGDLKLPRRHRATPLIFVLAFGLAFFGLVIIYSISPGLYDGDQGKINYEMWKRVAFFLASISLFFGARQLISLNGWRKASNYIFFLGLLASIALPILGAVHFPGVVCYGGACRWYNLALFTFQPAELLKLGTMLFMAGYLATRTANGKLDSWWTVVEVSIVLLVTMAVVVGLQKDMGTGSTLLAIFLVQFFMSGMSWRRFGFILSSMLVFFLLMIIVFPHRMDRIKTLFGSGDPDADYQINQALIGIGSGGLTGKGLGQSVQAYGYLPEAVNDSIFAVIGETLGFVGTTVLLSMFAWLGMTIFRLTNYLSNMYLRLVVVGFFAWFSSHVLVNSMSMIHLIPLTGITLPLVSSGGTSLLFMMVSLGIVSGISRYTSRVKINPDNLDNRKGFGSEDSLRGWRQRRSRYANSSSN